ncbi:MAG: class I SAM-dependent methyltransferase, partial [Bacteroidota bacterium]
MKQRLLTVEDVLAGYDAVSFLYPYVPPLSMWRAWEYAAYQGYRLAEPVLDVGCGDGRYFRLLWPDIRNVTGVDKNTRAAEAARCSGVYHEVRIANAHEMPFSSGSFASAFANCSLEHMDHLAEVLSSVHRCLKKGGLFVLSVVTDNFIEWSTLPLFVSHLDTPERASSVQRKYEQYHHLVNALPIGSWKECLESSGFAVLEHVPMIPEVTSRLFLFMDNLWHIKKQTDGEVGDALYLFLTKLKDFPKAFRLVLQGVLSMERDWSVGSGAVFKARSLE